jgi:DNA (cytosine-5)-methyltransferase 1
MSGDDLAPTITTKSMSISNGRFGHFDTKQNRALTPREAALLQTFPLGYVFHPEEQVDFAARLIGNAVPPKLAKYFGKYILDQIEE